MDIFITVIDADDKEPVTIRVGNIGTLKRVAPTAASDPDRGEYTCIEMSSGDPDYIRAVETVDQIMLKVADSIEAAQKLIATANMAVSTGSMTEVLKMVREILPLVRGVSTHEPEPERGNPARRICTTCKHCRTCASDAEPCKGCLASGDAKIGWEQEG